MELNSRDSHLDKNFIMDNRCFALQSAENSKFESLEPIYIEYFDILCLYGRQFSEEDPVFVQDCIQDLFINLFISKNNLFNSISIKFYLMKSLRRLIVNKKKSINKYKNIPLEIDTSPTLIEQYTIENKIFTIENNESQRMILQNYLLQLPKRQKEAIYLRFYSELKFDEIAGKMNLNAKSVYKIIYKGLRNLRKMYDKRNLELTIPNINIPLVIVPLVMQIQCSIF